MPTKTLNTSVVAHELEGEATARLQETLLDVCRQLEGDYLPALPASVWRSWNNALDDNGRFEFGVPQLENIRPFVRAIAAIRILQLAKTNADRDDAAELLRQAADEIDRAEFTHERANRLV